MHTFERRKLEVRTRIYAAARELFAKNGFDATTVDEIAAVADVAPATFFNHFQTKQALITLMTGEVVDHLHAITVDSLDRPGSAAERKEATEPAPLHQPQTPPPPTSPAHSTPPEENRREEG